MKITRGVGSFEETYLALAAEASAPYTFFVYDDFVQAERVQRLLFARGTGDLCPRFASILHEGDRASGILVAMTGSELQAVRLGAALALQKAALLTDGARRRLTTAASILLRPEPTDFYLSRIAVAPKCRGQGFGHMLLSYFEAEGRQRGASRLLLEVSPSHSDAIKMYTNAGFMDIGGGDVDDPETGRTLTYCHLAKATLAPA